MKLGSLKPARGAVKNKKRVGRGPGSGHGGTSTYGHKGAKARAGYSSRPWFEGGQMPLKRRLPKRGFTNVHAVAVEAINLRDLAGLTGTITAEMLEREGVIQNAEARLKVLGEGDLRGPVTIRAHGFSATARQKIEAAGGTAELIPAPKRLKRYRKKIRKETAEA